MHIDLYVYLQDYWWISMQKTSRGEKIRTWEVLRIQSEPVGPGNLEGCCCSEMAFQLFPMQLPCGQHAGLVTGGIPPCCGGIFLQPHRKLRWAGGEGQDHRAAGGHASCRCQQVPSAPLALSVQMALISPPHHLWKPALPHGAVSSFSWLLTVSVMASSLSCPVHLALLLAA